MDGGGRGQYTGKADLVVEVGVHAQDPWQHQMSVSVHCSMEITTTIPLHTDSFNNPWCFTLSDFPKGYKLFAVARPSIDVNPQRKDYYLCGMFYFFFSTCYLTDIF